MNNEFQGKISSGACFLGMNGFKKFPEFEKTTAIIETIVVSWVCKAHSCL